MQNNVSHLVLNQVPEYLRDESPLFTDFMRTYYAYAEQRTAALGLTQSRYLNADVDHTLDEYLHEFYDTYGEYLPTEVAMDKRNFIKLLNYIYEAKGTEKALKLVFRTVFGVSAEVWYPSVLIASDGRWVQETFITLQTIYGEQLEIGNVLLIDQTPITITNLIRVDSTNTRIYFKVYSKIDFYEDLLIKRFTVSGIVDYIGKLVKSPAKLNIGLPGKSWQRGQVISIPGTGKNTIARVTSVDITGAVLSVEILEYGYPHTENQTIIISPYPNKPVGSEVTIDSVANGDHFDHYITISDYTEGTEERLSGTIPGFKPISYFLEDYVESSYITNQVVEVVSTAGVTIAANVDTNLTMTEWLLSRATFSYEFANSVKTKGYYLDDSGQISNDKIRLEDNYFYQTFAYVIESSKDIKEYKRLLNITHPAGTKYFTTLVKLADYNIDVTSSRIRQLDTQYFTDSLVTDESAVLNINKSVSDEIFATHDDTAELSIGIYNTGYFASDYIRTMLTTEKHLVIG